MSPIVSEQYAYVIGVDTHVATHTVALVAVATGAVLAQAESPTSPAGLSRAHSWLMQRVGEQATLIVVEGVDRSGGYARGHQPADPERTG